MSQRPQIASGRAFARLGIGAAWGALMVALVGSAALGGILLADLIGGSNLGVAGFAVGVVLSVAVCRCLRRWIQRLRLRLMPSDAVATMATVVRVDELHTYGRAPNRTIYTVWFSWTDPDGRPELRERQYGFFAAGLRAFEVRVAAGTEIPIRYPAGRPNRFIADIPYTPTMADQLI